MQGTTRLSTTGHHKSACEGKARPRKNQPASSKRPSGACAHEAQEENELDNQRQEAPDRPKRKEEQPNLGTRSSLSMVLAMYKPCLTKTI